MEGMIIIYKLKLPNKIFHSNFIYLDYFYIMSLSQYAKIHSKPQEERRVKHDIRYNYYLENRTVWRASIQFMHLIGLESLVIFTGSVGL